MTDAADGVEVQLATADDRCFLGQMLEEAAGWDEYLRRGETGALWSRFPADDPGYGFVAEDVPELSIAVLAGWRGRGVGSRLLETVAAAAASRGVGAISLSVETTNPARALYASHGFREVSRAAGALTMLRDVGA